ncbi:MAG: undecaprenyl-diphosphate phosphatase, partial [Candidatus Omnitrophica bacterium]|nr:undecaprenyl-diphosphate phosphatase [Candidatus Omnitrophota bacterium]
RNNLYNNFTKIIGVLLTEIIILSIVQGICEWFPISSSGHLFLIRKILGLKVDINFDIFLHLSSLFVIIIFFRKEIVNVIKGFFTFDKENENFKLSFYIISASFITGLIGFFLKDKNFLENKNVVSFGFFTTTILLFLSGRNGEKKINFKSSLLTGFFQGIALIPGISRSGTTISIGKICGVESKEAFNFSFLIGIPAIIGAILVKFDEIKNIRFDFIIIGFLISFIISIMTLYLLKKILIKDKFKYFSIYTFIVFLLSLFIKQ